MPTKNPITAIGVLASLMLLVGGVMLYLIPATQAPQEQAQVLTSPFKEPEAAPKPAPAAPEPAAEPPAESPFSIPGLTPEELAKLTPDERTRYDKMRESLQQVVQQVQALEQENTRLQQTLTQSHATNQALDTEIDKLRPPQHVAQPAEP